MPDSFHPERTSDFNGPKQLNFDAAGNLYVAETYNSCVIHKITPSGTVGDVAGGYDGCGFAGDGGPATSAQMETPRGVVVGGDGSIYIADSGNDRIRKVNPSGIINTIAGNGVYGFAGDGGSAIKASLAYPTGLALDSAGDLFIADTGNSRIRKLTPQGIITTVAGNGSAGFSGDGGTATSASISFPTGVALDAAGNLYIADTDNERIRVVTPAGVISTVAGFGLNGFSGDGGSATAAALSSPSGVVVDKAGDIFIADLGNNRIREVFAGAASFTAAPVTMNFSAVAGGNSPGAQTIALSSSIAGLAYTASTSASWLSIGPSSGSVPALPQVTANPASLAAGSYQGTVTITVPNAVPSSATVAVAFTVTPAVPAALGTDTKNVSFTAIQGTGAQMQQLHVLNTGGGSLSFTASASTASGGSWLSVSPANGAATPSSPVAITLTATPGSLAPGTYSGAIAVTGAGSTVNIPVTLSVNAPTAVILVSQVGMSFTAVAQGGVPLAQNVGILNVGQGSMSWSASVTTLSGGNWLQISPSSGAVAQPYLDVSPLAVSVNPGTLAAGTYYGQIQVSAAAANTPQLITVILTVLPAGVNPGPQIYPTGLIFTGAAGTTPGSQTVQVANPTAQVNSFQSGAIGTGFSFLPTNASLEPSQPTTILVYPNFASLAPGSVQQGTITLQFADRSPSQSIDVLAVVAPSGATPDADPKTAAACSTLPLNVQVRSLQPNFSATQGQAVTLEAQVVDGCGNLVGSGGQSAVMATLTTGDPPIAMANIGNGIWQGTWKPGPSAAGLSTVSVTAIGPTGVSGQSGGLSGTVTSPSSSTGTPIVTGQGVVHAASGQSGVPISPGELIAIYGLNLATASGQPGAFPLPAQYEGTEVLLGTQPLPILYASPGQLNLQVPYNVPVNTQYQLTVLQPQSLKLSLPQSLVVAPAQPGIFTVNQKGTGQGIILKSNGVTLAEPGTPANIGETVVIYCTGLGAVTPAVKEGTATPTSALTYTVNTVTATIGGAPAQVVFSGLTPTLAGLYQVNAVVPAGIATGNSVPVTLSVAGQTSPPVTIAVQ